LTGTLPDTIGGLENLEVFSVANNQLQGTIPASISNWTSLEEAYFSDNDLTGSMPNAVCSIVPLPVLHVDCFEVSCDCCNC
jgi:Leucine-rich repeat (LRR) protein